MIIGLFGDVGSGKTVNGIRFIVDSLINRGYKIFTNLNLTGIEFTYITIEDLLDIVEKGHEVVCPEAYILDEIILLGLDSRHGSKVSQILSYLMLQNRKLSFNEKTHPTYFIYTTQYPDLIDNRLWRTSEIKISHFKIEYNDKTYIFRFWYIKKFKGIVTKIDYFIADPYFKYFNTKQIVKVSHTDRYKNYKYKDPYVKELPKQKTLKKFVLED